MAKPPKQAHCSNPSVPSRTANEYGVSEYSVLASWPLGLLALPLWNF
jgi:hypothetical protein